MSEYESQASELTDFMIKIENCLLNGLKSSQSLIDSQTIKKISQKIQEIDAADSTVEAIEYFLFSLIGASQKYKQQTQIDIDREDYQKLQEAVQKAEAEIRKHIRLEQQLKIYMDGLEEKNQQLQKELKIESQKYLQLFEAMKAVDAEKRELNKRLKDQQMRARSSIDKQPSFPSHKTSKMLTESNAIQSQGTAYGMYKMLNDRNRITKSKNFMEKNILNGQMERVADESEKKGLQKDINVSLKHSPTIKQRTSSQKTEIKQMTRTIQLKQNYRKQSRKLLKYSTQHKISITAQKKSEARCNSVCH